MCQVSEPCLCGGTDQSGQSGLAQVLLHLPGVWQEPEPWELLPKRGGGALPALLPEKLWSAWCRLRSWIFPSSSTLKMSFCYFTSSAIAIASFALKILSFQNYFLFTLAFFLHICRAYSKYSFDAWSVDTALYFLLVSISDSCSQARVKHC